MRFHLFLIVLVLQTIWIVELAGHAEVKTKLDAKRNTSIIRRKSNKCETLHCPDTRDPTCVKIKRKSTNKEQYLTLPNKCEVKRRKCVKDLEISIQPQELCDKYSKPGSNQDKRIQRKKNVEKTYTQRRRSLRFSKMPYKYTTTSRARKCLFDLFYYDDKPKKKKKKTTPKPFQFIINYHNRPPVIITLAPYNPHNTPQTITLIPNQQMYQFAPMPPTNPPRTFPPKTNPPQTFPPKTNPPKTNPPQTFPPKTNPPQIITFPPTTKTTKETTIAPTSETTIKTSVEASSETLIKPSNELPKEPSNEPPDEQSYEPSNEPPDEQSYEPSNEPPNEQSYEPSNEPNDSSSSEPNEFNKLKKTIGSMKQRHPKKSKNHTSSKKNKKTKKHREPSTLKKLKKSKKDKKTNFMKNVIAPLKLDRGITRDSLELYPEGPMKPGDSKAGDTDCPQSCPAHDIPVCAKCQHGIYRSFMSVCHMRMYSCSNPGDEILLVARRSCVKSSMYALNSPMQGMVAEPKDEILRYVRCRERNRINVDADCKFD